MPKPPVLGNLGGRAGRPERVKGGAGPSWRFVGAACAEDARPIRAKLWLSRNTPLNNDIPRVNPACFELTKKIAGEMTRACIAAA